MASAKTSRDWFDFVTAVERIRKVPSQQAWPHKNNAGRSSTAWDR
jgi:hypothetical protein